MQIRFLLIAISLLVISYLTMTFGAEACSKCNIMAGVNRPDKLIQQLHNSTKRDRH